MTALDEVLKIAETYLPTEIFSHHDEECEVARKYLIALDRLLMPDNPLEPPSWLREKYRWGPVQHPMFWCQLIRARELDCGAFSAVVREIYQSRGVVALPVQAILEYPLHVIQHWKEMWRKKGISINWIWEKYVYHEIVGVISKDNKIKIYDPVENVWINPLGYVERGRLVALRIIGGPSRLYWEGRHIITNRWYFVKGH